MGASESHPANEASHAPPLSSLDNYIQPGLRRTKAQKDALRNAMREGAELRHKIVKYSAHVLTPEYNPRSSEDLHLNADNLHRAVHEHNSKLRTALTDALLPPINDPPYTPFEAQPLHPSNPRLLADPHSARFALSSYARLMASHIEEAHEMASTYIDRLPNDDIATTA